MSKKIPPPTNSRNSPKWSKDRLAKFEEEEFDSLDEIREKNDRIFLSNYGWIRIILLWVGLMTIIISIGIWLFHFLTPWCWLEEYQLSKIQTVIFSGAIGAYVSALAARFL